MVTYRVGLAAAARRALTQDLPVAVAAAVYELMTGALAQNPQRVGKPLGPPYEGMHGARRGDYRIRYRIDLDQQVVTVLAIQHRRDAYRR